MPSRLPVFIINGYPRAGKDTFVGYVNDYLFRIKGRTCVYNCSSIDPVRKMLEGAGFDLSHKTPGDRALLSQIGDYLQEYNHFRTDYCKKIALQHSKHKAVFIHLREPPLISLLSRELADEGLECHTVFIDRELKEKLSNHADMNVKNYNYDVYISNNSTLEGYIISANNFAHKYILMHKYFSRSEEINILPLRRNHVND